MARLSFNTLFPLQQTLALSKLSVDRCDPSTLPFSLSSSTFAEAENIPRTLSAEWNCHIRTLIRDPKPSICSLCFPLNPWRARGQDHYVCMSVVMFCPSALVMYGDMRLEIKISVERMSGLNLATAATAKAKLKLAERNQSTRPPLLPHSSPATTVIVLLRYL